MALGIVVDDDKDENAIESSDGAAWVLARVEPWEDYRKTSFEERWDEYYCLWRGIWRSEDKAIKSERSKLITPALQQAIEATVAELEEATFGKGKWFDVNDDISDEDKSDIKPFRDLLQEDLDRAGARAAISEVYLNSALYGTGIGKLVTKEVEIKSVGQESVDESGMVFEASAETRTEVEVSIVAVSPYEFVIDPAANSIEDSLGCAHIFSMPKHQVLINQEEGRYNDVEVGSYTGDMKLFTDETRADRGTDQVKITEYHGLFPRSLLDTDLDEGEEVVDLNLGISKQDGNNTDVGLDKETDLVECIVIIANDSVLLRATENQGFMQDRAFVAYQHDTIPNRFWGRGIAEKGYWPQKANDAEVRARIDAMALTVRPMMGVDATRIPRGANFKIEAGKTILTQGNPNEVLRPFSFGQVGPNTFTQSGELERMVQMGTGAMDSATGVGINTRNATASGMSMISSGAIKRAKRTMANIERHFLVPFVQKAAYRMMQFDPRRYPTKDVKFVAASTLGLMARELEQQQLTTLLQTTEPNGVGYWMLMRSIYENSNIADREGMVAIADKKLQEAMNPQPPQPPPPTPLDQAKIQDIQSKINDRTLSLQIEKTRSDTERMRVLVEAQKADAAEAKDTSVAILNLAKAEGAESGTQLNKYASIVDAMEFDAAKEAEEISKKIAETAQMAAEAQAVAQSGAIDEQRPTSNGNPPRPV